MHQYNIGECTLSEKGKSPSHTWAQGSTIRVRGVHTYTWATGTYAWLISCLRSHVSTFPFRLDYKTSKSRL